MHRKYEPVQATDTVASVVDHPAFRGFGHLLFPLEGQPLDPDMKLDQVAELMYYNDGIDVNMTARVINHLLRQVEAGEKVFYGIRSAQDMENFPRTRDTGLFYFRGKPGAPFAIVCPGGAFKYVSSVHESFPLAMALSEMGYNTFALQYRIGSAAIACEDLAYALTFVFENAQALAVDAAGYSLWGASAGARMVAYLGSYGASAYGGAKLPRPAAVIMQYTSHADYTENDPPTYAIIGDSDGIASRQVMETRIDLLRGLGIDAEFHVCPDLGHGFGLGIGTSAEGWEADAVRFWIKHASCGIPEAETP